MTNKTRSTSKDEIQVVAFIFWISEQLSSSKSSPSFHRSSPLPYFFATQCLSMLIEVISQMMMLLMRCYCRDVGLVYNVDVLLNEMSNEEVPFLDG